MGSSKQHGHLGILGMCHLLVKVSTNATITHQAGKVVTRTGALWISEGHVRCLWRAKARAGS